MAKEKISGAEALIRSLIAEQTEYIFGYPGGAIMPVFDVLYDYRDRINHILVRHEQGATHAAQGYARVSGKTGVVMVTSGPAATNIITGLSDAMMDSTPLIVITGQVGSSLLGSDAFQETDVVGITQPVTKWSYQIRHSSEIAWAVARAFYIAGTGRPGPVVLDIAKDAQTGLTEYEYQPCQFIRSYNPYPTVKADEIEAAARLINQARKPFILAGQGVLIANAEEELVRLAEKADIPVGCTLLGLSAIPTDHPLYKGMLGMHGSVASNIKTNECDLLIAIGMRFDDRVTGDITQYARQARIIHIDIDPAEFNKNVKCDVSVLGDARAVLQALLPKVEPARHTKWLESFASCEEVERIKVIEPEIHPQKPLMNMGEVARKVSEATDNDSILVTDVGQNQMLSARYYRFKRPRSLVTSGGLGTMACRHRRQDRRTRPHGLLLYRRRRHTDDHTGAGHHHAVWHRREDYHSQQQFSGYGTAVASPLLQPPLLRDSHAQPRLYDGGCRLRNRRRTGGHPRGARRGHRAHARPPRLLPARRANRPRRHGIPHDPCRSLCDPHHA